MATLNLNDSVKTRDKLLKSQQKEIKDFYARMADLVSKKASALEGKENISSILRKKYLEDLNKELDAQVKSFNKELKSKVENNMTKAAESVIKDNNKWIEKAGLSIEGAYMHVPKEAVESVLTGQLYKGKWSLSSTVWKDTKTFSKDINTVVAEGIAQNKSAFDIAKDLEKYVDPSAAKDWDWSKVYPGVRKKVDYNAQRLARTMVQHAYQQTLERSLKPNPFNKGIKWHSALAADRTCEICRDRNGKIFEKGKVPMDHPNGLCTFIPIMEDLDKVASDLADWVNGKPNKDIDKWVKSMKGKEPKVKDKDKEPEVKKTKFQSDFEKIKTDIQDKGFYLESDVKAAGKLIQKELAGKRIDSKNAMDKLKQEIEDLGFRKLEKDLQQLKNAMRDLITPQDVGLNSLPEVSKKLKETREKLEMLRPKHEALYDKYVAATKVYEGKASDNAKELKTLLGELREMGIKDKTVIDTHLNNSKSQVKKFIIEAYDYYPTDWVEKSSTFGKIIPKKADRGYYKHYLNRWESEMAISGYTDEQFLATAFHELGHRFERTVPGILEAEKKFYNRRTDGEELQWLGGNYAKDEVSRFDDFTHKYMGKDYGGTAYELVSMGFEDVYTNPTSLWRDPDYAEWIYGILSIL